MLVIDSIEFLQNELALCTCPGIASVMRDGTVADFLVLIRVDFQNLLLRKPSNELAEDQHHDGVAHDQNGFAYSSSG